MKSITETKSKEIQKMNQTKTTTANTNGYSSSSSVEFELDSNKQYTIRYKEQKTTMEKQDHFDDVLELIEHLVETNYTFDTLRYCTVNSIVKDINYLFSHKNRKRKVYHYNNLFFKLTPVDYHDYEDLIRCILDDNLFELSENDILMVHEHFK